MANDKIRQTIAAAGLKHYQVADAIGITPGTLSVWLRHELEGEKLDQVEKAIEKLTEGGNKE